MLKFSAIARAAGLPYKELEAAGQLCDQCVVKGRCDRWIATHAEGEGASPPAFCPSAKIMKENS